MAALLSLRITRSLNGPLGECGEASIAAKRRSVLADDISSDEPKIIARDVDDDVEDDIEGDDDDKGE